MLLKRDLLEEIKAGRVDLVFRRWNRPSVKPGGTLKTKLGLLQIGAMDEMDPGDVVESDAQRAGFTSLADFHLWLATMKPGHIFQRIEVSYLGEA